VHKILILDFGSQYTQLIARRIREIGIYSEIHPFNYPLEKIKTFAPDGIILSGGPASVLEEGSPRCDIGVFEVGVPILSICYGMQLMAQLLGGRVEKGEKREYGPAEIFILKASPLFADFPLNTPVMVWMSHGDRVVAVPPGFYTLTQSPNSPIAVMANEEKRLYGLQFHPEVVHTPEGKKIVANFLFHICGLKPDWDMGSFIEQTIPKIRAQVGKSNVVCALSGGVDSSVVAVLLNKAIGKRLHAIFVNNGLLRAGEVEEVKEVFTQKIPLNFHYVDAEERFLAILKGVTDPEEKRKRIGRLFIEVFEEEARKIGDVEFLAQGTLYPDVIESISFKGPSATM